VKQGQNTSVEFFFLKEDKANVFNHITQGTIALGKKYSRKQKTFISQR